MTKRIAAAMLALVMCAGMVSCGGTDEKENSKSADNSAAASDEKGEGKSDTGNTLPETDMDIANVVIDKNVAQNEADLTEEEAAAFIELTASQYRAVQTKDTDAFIKTMNLPKIASASADCMHSLVLDSEEIPDDQMAKNQVLYTSGIMMLSCDWPGIDEYDFTEDSDGSKLREIIQGLADSLTADNFKSCGMIDQCIMSTDNELKPMNKLSADTVTSLELDTITREGDDIYLTCDISILDGDDQFVLSEVSLWRVGGEYGVLISDAFIKDNPYKGMTAEEIRKQEKEETEKNAEAEASGELLVTEDIANDISEDAFRAVQEIMDTMYTEGSDVSEQLAKLLPRCCKESGLDLSAEFTAEDDCEQALAGKMEYSGVTSGRVMIGGYNEETNELTVYYISEDGVQGSFTGELTLK